MQKTKIIGVHALWMLARPYDKANAADRYYIQKAIELKKLLEKLITTQKASFMPELNAAHMAVFFTGWFEDIVSELGLWSTFIFKNKEVYGKLLPFYDTIDDYYVNEPNPQDTRLLAWIYYNSMVKKEEKKIPLSPSWDFFDILGSELFDYFDDLFDDAPENNELVDIVTPFALMDDYFIATSKIKAFSTLWLFGFTEVQRLMMQQLNMEELESGTIDDLSMIDPDGYFYYPFLHKTEFHGLTIAQWYAEYISDRHVNYHDIYNISFKNGYTIVEKSGKNDLTFKTGTQLYTVTCHYPEVYSFKKGDKVAVAICTYRNCAHFLNGIVMTDDDQFHEGHKLLTDEIEKEIKQENLRRYEYVKGKYQSTAFYFANLQEMIGFIEQFEDKKPFSSDFKSKLSEISSIDNIMILIHAEGISMLPNMNEYIPDPANHMYTGITDGVPFILLLQSICDSEMFKYLCSLTEFRETLTLPAQLTPLNDEDLDFFIRFFKNYHVDS